MISIHHIHICISRLKTLARRRDKVAMYLMVVKDSNMYWYSSVVLGGDHDAGVGLGLARTPIQL